MKPRFYVFSLLSLLGVAVLVALGIWQIERRAWKLDLIDRVEHRVHAAPAALPDRASWQQVNSADDAYRHVRVTGHFLNSRETLVTAVTDFGSGYWVITPLRTEQGAIVLVNRGFVPSGRRDPSMRGGNSPAGLVEVTGLLRMSEPGGGFLRKNDPEAGRWYSRDVAAIARAHGLADVAPFFVDADAGTNSGEWPRGGLTVISFPNNHLVYAFTWFTLAAMLAGATFRMVRDEWRSRNNRLDVVSSARNLNMPPDPPRC